MDYYGWDRKQKKRESVLGILCTTQDEIASFLQPKFLRILTLVKKRVLENKKEFMYVVHVFSITAVHLQIIKELLKTKLSKFEDLIGFIQQFMNQTASHLTNRTRRSCTKWKAFIGGSGQERKFLTKSGLFQARSPFFGDGRGLWQITSLVLSR